MEKQEIVQGITKKGFSGTKQDIQDKIEYLIQKGILYEPRPSKWRLMIY